MGREAQEPWQRGVMGHSNHGNRQDHSNRDLLYHGNHGNGGWGVSAQVQVTGNLSNPGNSCLGTTVTMAMAAWVTQ